MEIHSRPPPACLPLVLMLAACGGGDDDAAPDCSFAACGGDPVGEWDVSFCLDDEPLEDDDCPDARFDVSVDIDGSWSFRDDMTHEAMVTTTLSMDATIPQSCQQGRPCEEDEECVTEGDSCRCRFTLEDPDTVSGTWTASGTSLTFESEDGDASTPYCVDGDVMKMPMVVEGPPVPYSGLRLLERRAP